MASLGIRQLYRESDGTFLKDVLYDKGLVGGIDLGYQKAFSGNLLAGLGIYGNLAKLEGHQLASPYDIKFGLRNAVGVSLKLGAVIGSTLAYVKMGVESARWIQQGSYFSHSIPRGKKHVIGFGPAFGTETKLSDCINLGLEVRGIRYSVTRIPMFIQNTGILFKHIPTLLDGRITLKYQFSDFNF
jgi:opacity protein-like surface antigen